MPAGPASWSATWDSRAAARRSAGHASHQIGLDADVWLTPMPDHRLSREEREEMSAVMMVRPDRLDVDPRGLGRRRHLLVLRDAAQEPSVQRIFVNAAIKKALCREAKGDRSWLSKIRPWYGHDYHFHIRMACPPGSSECKGQKPQEGGEGCGAGRSSPTGSRIRSSIRRRRKSRRSRAADDAGAHCRRPASRCWRRPTPSHSCPLIGAGFHSASGCAKYGVAAP